LLLGSVDCWLSWPFADDSSAATVSFVFAGVDAGAGVMELVLTVVL
jgi:hypothetical protein